MDNAKKLAEDMIICVLNNPLGMTSDQMKKFIDRAEPCQLDLRRIAEGIEKENGHGN